MALRAAVKWEDLRPGGSGYDTTWCPNPKFGFRQEGILAIKQ